MSVSASGAYGQAASTNASLLTVWAEGGSFRTGGGSFNVPTLPGVTAPFTAFDPRGGLTGAVGFDYRWANQPWHFVFDFRFGKSKTTTSSSSSFQTFGLISSVLQTSTTSSTGIHRESHSVADFMVGRDMGFGTNKVQLQAGIRVADLRTAAQVLQQGQTTFYSISLGSVTTAQSSSGSWRSRFFGVGPRVAVTGSIPIVGFWTFDYGGGVAGLFGDRLFDFAVTNTGGPNFAANFKSSVVVFNADASIALSYLLSPNFKVSSGVRADYYNSALTTYNVGTGALQNISRTFWGPFIRLTGTL
jgi:hypothetical protein